MVSWRNLMRVSFKLEPRFRQWLFFGKGTEFLKWTRGFRLEASEVFQKLPKTEYPLALFLDCTSGCREGIANLFF